MRVTHSLKRKGCHRPIFPENRILGYLLDSGGYYMLWFRTTDNRFVRYWCHRDRLLDKSIEEFATTTGRPPVEPECEFVQVIVEMFHDSPLLGACRAASASAATPHDELVASTPRAISSSPGER